MSNNCLGVDGRAGDSLPRMNTVYGIAHVLSRGHRNGECHQQHHRRVRMQPEHSRINFHMIHLLAADTDDNDTHAHMHTKQTHAQ